MLFVQIRITSCKAYSLFTYSKNPKADWPKRMEEYVFSTFHGTADTSFGLKMEDACLDIFQQANPNATIHRRCGLIVNKYFPWFGFSPDAIMVYRGKKRLLEIKSLKVGKETFGMEFVQRASCLERLKMGNEGLTLKKKHPFYGQIQLGLAVCDLEEASLLLYVHKNKSVITVDVRIDVDFIREFTSQLFNVYFEYLLPFYIKNEDRLRIRKMNKYKKVT